MRDFGGQVRTPGRLMLAAGVLGFGLIALRFNHVIDGLTPIEAGPPFPILQGVALTLLGLGLAWPQSARIAARILMVGLIVNFALHLLLIIAALTDATRWVSTLEVLGLLSAAALLGLGPRPGTLLEARAAIGLMLILFGAVHWMYVGAIAGMIPDWMPGREVWPWITGGACIAAGLAVVSGVQARLASGLAGAMFASWILLVHTPHLLAAPDDRSEWVALALAFALTGVVWTLREALPQSGAELPTRGR